MGWIVAGLICGIIGHPIWGGILINFGIYRHIKYVDTLDYIEELKKRLG